MCFVEKSSDEAWGSCNFAVSQLPTDTAISSAFVSFRFPTVPTHIPNLLCSPKPQSTRPPPRSQPITSHTTGEKSGVVSTSCQRYEHQLAPLLTTALLSAREHTLPECLPRVRHLSDSGDGFANTGEAHASQSLCSRDVIKSGLCCRPMRCGENRARAGGPGPLGTGRLCYCIQSGHGKPPRLVPLEQGRTGRKEGDGQAGEGCRGSRRPGRLRGPRGRDGGEAEVAGPALRREGHTGAWGHAGLSGDSRKPGFHSGWLRQHRTVLGRRT